MIVVTTLRAATCEMTGTRPRLRFGRRPGNAKTPAEAGVREVGDKGLEPLTFRV